MTLEDFFTLTEMKNGLSTLARVEELISVMGSQKGCVMNNAGDTARQWSTVAGTLAATENKDCLKHFVELNGLFFLNQWLQESLKCSNGVSSNTTEEVINSLLGSLERLPLDKEKSTAHGIWVTVEHLLGQNNPNIKERVRNLLDKWKNRRVDDVGNQDMENGGRCQDTKCKPSADANTVEVVHSLHLVDISSHNAVPQEVDCSTDFVGTESHHSNSTKCSDGPGDVKISTPNQTMPTESPNSANANANEEEINSPESSNVSKSHQENFAITEESSVPVVEMASAHLCRSTGGRENDADKHSEASELNNVDSAKEMELEVEVNITEGSLCKASQKESCNASSSPGVSVSLSARKMESTVSCNFDLRERKGCISKNGEPQPMNKGVDCGLPNYPSTTEELNCVAHVARGSQDLPSSVCNLRKIDGPENSIQGKEDVGGDGSIKEHCSEGKLKVCERVNLVSTSKRVGMKVTDETDRRSEIELECGEIDALEVARQVALEVEREVVDYREPFCSSSPDIDLGGRVESYSPDLVEGKQNQPVMEEINGSESSVEKDLSDSASSPKDDNCRIPVQSDIDTERHEQVFKPELISVARETDCKSDKNVFDFDLNEDVCNEDDHSTNSMHKNLVNLSAPKAIVAASKGSPGLPVSPLCFEGELGWKVSAARSAFRPASPRKTPDAELTYLGSQNKMNVDVCKEDDHSTNSMHNNLVNLSAPKAVVAASKGAPGLPVSPLCFEGELGWKVSAARSAFRPTSRKIPDAEQTYLGPQNKTNVLEIDLNVAESEDNVADDQTSVRLIPCSLGFPSGESTMEDSSRRAGRLKLDLNRLGDEDMSPRPSSFWKLRHQNGDQCLSTATSSSRHSSVRDFDLNDNPSLFDIGSSHNPNQSSSKASDMSGSSELDDPVVAIMGSRMAVGKKEYCNQTRQSYLGNGPSLEPAVFGGHVLPYAHMRPPAYVYNGHATVPAMPYPPALYGPGRFPYMVDSRGAPVMPQILGSAGLSGACSATPPFLMSIAGAPVSLNGIGSWPSGLDLNSGTTFMDRGNRESGGFSQFVQQGHNVLMEEQTWTASQLAGSQMTLKRREPESGWEPCSLGSKRVTSWQ